MCKKDTEDDQSQGVFFIAILSIEGKYLLWVKIDRMAYDHLCDPHQNKIQFRQCELNSRTISIYW